jgi:hypothetical protein
VKAAEQLIRGAPSTYNPLYVHSLDSARCVALLEAVGRTYLEGSPEARVGFTSLTDFAMEYVNAIQDGVAGAWRERWWSLDLLLIHGVQDLAFVERAQDEVFHLFEALIRAGGRILVAGDRPPSRLEGVDERLESKFEGGLVVDLGAEPVTRTASKATAAKERPTEAGTPRETKEPARPEDRPTIGEWGEPGIPWPPPHFDPATPPPSGKATPSSASRPKSASTPRPAKAPEAPAKPSAPTAPAAEKRAPAATHPPRVPGADDLAALKELVGVVHVASDDAKAAAPAGHEPAPSAPGGTSGRRWVPSPEKAVLDWPEIEERIAEGAVRHSEVPDGHRG